MTQLRSKALILTSISIVFFSRFLTFIARPQASTSPDSSTYFTGRFLDFELVSFTGHSSRGWLVPLIFAFAPNGSALIVIQLIISGFAWALLILTVNNLFEDSKFLRILLVGITVISSSPQVIQHDTVILATSITNSLFLILVSVLFKINLGKVLSSKILLSALFASFLLMIQKTTYISICLALLAVTLILNWKSLQFKNKVGSIFLITVISVSSILTGANINANWQVSYSGQTLLWQLGAQSPTADSFANFLKEKNAPECITAEAPFQNLDTSMGKILNDCPAGGEYLKKNLQREFAVFLLTNPTAAIKLVSIGFGATATSASSNYGSAVSIFPDFASKIFFGSTSPNIAESSISDQVEGMKLLNSGKSFWLFTPIFGWIFLAFLGMVLLRNSVKEDGFLYLASALCLLQSALTFVLLPSEWVRQSSPFTISALVISLLLVTKHVSSISDLSTKNDR